MYYARVKLLEFHRRMNTVLLSDPIMNTPTFDALSEISDEILELAERKEWTTEI